MSHLPGFPPSNVSPFISVCLFAVGLCITPAQCAWAVDAKTTDEDSFSAEEIKFFEQHIRPLLAKHCFECHGEEKQSSNLRLDSRQAMIVGGDSGSSLEPGDPDASFIVDAVKYQSFEMPPTGQLPDKEIKLLEKWVKMGAPWPASDKSPRGAASSGSKITEEDRQFWSFLPIRDPEVPDVSGEDWCFNEIDHFIYAKLRENGLKPSPQADKRTLMRRVYFDVIGLPPTPEEIETFVKNDSPNAYEQLVDDLLDRQEYGEKWARHWLDLVRYAESDGFRADGFRPQAWRYRDYVIKSFNEDKPYDQFVAEQLAGDEIAPHDPEALTATAYLRHGIYEYNQRDVRTQWQDILNDITDTTGDVFLGLGMGCARCHDHKFDPILQKDYYSLQAFFTPLLPRDDVPLATAAELKAHAEATAQWEAATKEIRAQLDEITNPIMDRLANSAIDKFPKDIQAMMRTPVQDRTPFEHQLAELAHRQVIDLQNRDLSKKIPKEKKEKYEQLKKELAQYDDLKPKPLAYGMTVTDVSEKAPNTYLAANPKKPVVEPASLTVLNADDTSLTLPDVEGTTGRRTALAKWLTSTDNPLTSRVMVNRLWHYHFGRGLAATTSDFGHLGEEPTHPLLLDWLARRFMEKDWSMKAMHRLILNSATYRQLAVVETSPEASRIDPTNSLLWKMNLRRLDSEQIRDAALAASGELQIKLGGSSVSGETTRRSIYVKNIRNSLDRFLGAFDTPRGLSSTSRRNVTTTPTQALMMINGDWLQKRAANLARESLKQSDGKPKEAAKLAMLRVFGRGPTDVERSAIEDFLKSRSEVTREPDAGFGSLREEYGSALRVDVERSHSPAKAPALQQLKDGAFTVEAIIQLDSLYPDATVRTIASHWDNNKAHAGWALGVTSAKSAYTPRNLIMQLIGRDAGGELKYEVVASNLFVELNVPYRATATVIPGAGEQGAKVEFTLRKLVGEFEPETKTVQSSVVSGFHTPSLDLVIGGRHGSSRHAWHGLLDEITLSNDATLARWNFDSPNERLSSVAETPMVLERVGDSGNSHLETLLTDYCHVLLNSNQFLYVD